MLASARGLTRLLDINAQAAGTRGPPFPASPTPVPPLARAAAALHRLALRRAPPAAWRTPAALAEGEFEPHNAPPGSHDASGGASPAWADPPLVGPRHTLQLIHDLCMRD